MPCIEFAYNHSVHELLLNIHNLRLFLVLTLPLDLIPCMLMKWLVLMEIKRDSGERSPRKNLTTKKNEQYANKANRELGLSAYDEGKVS